LSQNGVNSDYYFTGPYRDGHGLKVTPSKSSPHILELFVEGEDLGDLIDFSKTQDYDQLVDVIVSRFPSLDKKTLVLFYTNKDDKKIKITRDNFHYRNLMHVLKEIHVKNSAGTCCNC